MLRSFLLLPFALLLLNACNNKKEEKQSLVQADEIAVLTPEQEKIVEEYCLEFAENVKSADAKAVAKAFRANGYVDRILDGMKLPDDYVAGFKRSLAKDLGNREGGLAWAMLGQHVDYVGFTELSDRRLPVFRVITSEGFDYVMMLARVSENGNVQFDDIYTLSNSDWASRSAKRLIMPLIQADLKGRLNKYLSDEEDLEYLKHIEEIGQMTQALHAGDTETFLKLHKGLPEEIQKTRLMRGLLIAALPVEDERYLEEIRKVAKDFPEDGGVILLTIDLDALEGNWEEAQRKVDLLEKIVGGDPYCNTLRGNIKIMEEDYEGGISYLEKAVTDIPDLEDPVWALAAAYSATRKFTQARELYERLQDEFDYEFVQQDFMSEEDKAFRESEEGKTFLKTLPASR